MNPETLLDCHASAFIAMQRSKVRPVFRLSLRIT